MWKFVKDSETAYNDSEHNPYCKEFLAKLSAAKKLGEDAENDLNTIESDAKQDPETWTLDKIRDGALLNNQR